MKQTLRIVIPLVVLVGVVFGATYFSRYTRKIDDGKATKSPEPPLRFGSSTRAWNPIGPLQDQAFAGFYERSGDAAGQKNTAAFWFENRNDKGVTVALRGVTCTSCSGGRVAAIPADLTRQLLQMSAVQALPQGLVSGLPTGAVLPAAHFDPRHEKLKWQSYDFQHNPNATYKVPAAGNADPWVPYQWGVLELLFSVDVGPKAITAVFDVCVDGSDDHQMFEFRLAFEGVEPFAVSRGEIALGEMSEAGDREYRGEVLVYSSTRGPGSALGDLAVPAVVVDVPPGYAAESAPFVSVGAPARVPEAELLTMMESLSRQLKKPTRIRAAYRVPVVVRTRLGERKIDLGPLERVLSITVPQTLHSKPVSVTGTVSGGTWLDDGRREIRLTDTYKRGTAETFRVVTDNPAAELGVVEAECKPEFMKVTLEKLPPARDRGFHNLKIVVPKESKAGLWSGVIVLETKGPNPQRIRIPVTGKGSN